MPISIISVVVFGEAEMRLIGCRQWHDRFTAERHYCHRYVQGVETLLDLGMFDAVMAQVEVPRLLTVAQVAANVIVSLPIASSSSTLTPTRQLAGRGALLPQSG